MPAINPYLNFPGTTEEAFNLYKSVFGGEFIAVMRFKDVPGIGDIRPEDQDKIMHIALPIGNNIIMATDALESMGQRLQKGNNQHICISADSREQADQFFNALAEGGKVEMPMEDMFWGDYFGSLQDRYGINWILSYENKKS